MQGWVEKVKREAKQKTTDTDNSVVMARGKGVGAGRRGDGRITGDRRRLDLRW